MDPKPFDRVGRAKLGNPDLATTTVRGTVQLHSGEQLWLLLFSFGTCSYYFGALATAAVDNDGSWAQWIGLSRRDPGTFELYALIFNARDSDRVQRAFADLARHGNGSGLYQLPPAVRSAHVPVTCCID